MKQLEKVLCYPGQQGQNELSFTAKAVMAAARPLMNGFQMLLLP